MDCIFCKIIKGAIPSYKVYEDEHVYAFLDISQVTQGHTLIVPKNHVRSLYDLDVDTAKKVFAAVPHIAGALKRAFNPIGMNLINNTERPHQTVDHFHVHLIPRYERDRFDIRFTNNQSSLEQEDYQTILKKIQEHV